MSGAEYRLLPHLLYTGALCAVDVAMVEMHRGNITPLYYNITPLYYLLSNPRTNAGNADTDMMLVSSLKVTLAPSLSRSDTTTLPLYTLLRILYTPHSPPPPLTHLTL